MAKKAEFSIETVKKYVFWAVMPIGLIVAVATTFMAVGQVTKAFNDKKSALEAQKQAVEKIRGETAHPNEDTIKEIENCAKQLRGRVLKAWIALEKDQRERNQWPDAVGEEFLKEVAKLVFGDEISIDSREFYLTFVEQYLPQLEYDVERRRVQYLEDGEWKDVDPMKDFKSRSPGMGGDEAFNILDRQGRSTMDGTSSMSEGSTTGYQPKVNEDGEEIERMVGVVDWPNPETRTVTSSWERLPKSNEVWFAQEELWVYDALLSVIQKSNVGATGPHNAAVKRIENLLIGQAAAMPLSAQLKRRPGSSGGGMEGMMSMEGGSAGGTEGGGAGGTGGMMVAKTEEDVITMK
ncbi:MAG: hypothetical protein FWE67_13250, partial [Planctomycetaceae bacterium]|nr:hypothetical protein [Planctomycetaceae bacterium]